VDLAEKRPDGEVFKWNPAKVLAPRECFNVLQDYLDLL